MMMLKDYLRNNKRAIVDKWIEKTLASYPAKAADFYSKQKNQFANPVGSTLSSGLEVIYECLVSEFDSGKICHHLNDIIMIRAIQDFTPSQAVSFVFSLKEAVRETLYRRLNNPKIFSELMDFEKQIDQIALFTFDILVQRREKFYEVRINEMKRSISTVIKRMNKCNADSDTDSDQHCFQLEPY